MTEEKDELAKAFGFTVGALAGYLLVTVVQALLIGLILKYMIGLSVTYFQVLGGVLIWDLIKPKIHIEK